MSRQKIQTGVSKVFIAGSTGYTGREVVRQWRELGIETIAHVRPDSPEKEKWRERFLALGADVDETPWSEKAMTSTFARLKPGAIFALLGTTQAKVKQAVTRGLPPPDYEAVDFGLTAILIRAAVAAGIRPVFVYLSSSGAGGKAPGAYLAARRKAEGLLVSSGLPHVIARPAIITGPDRDEARPLERYGAKVLDTALSVVGALGARQLARRYRSTTNAKIAAALIRLSGDPQALNRAFESEDLQPANAL